MIIVGLDLAGKPENPSGFCVMTEEGVKTTRLHSDNEILREIEKARPDLICVDAPLSFPEEGYWRQGEREMEKEGFRPLSPKFPGMQPLVKRAMVLVAVLRRKYQVIEVFPRATEKVLGTSRSRSADPDEYDAMLCALTGKYYLQKNFRAFGPERIIVPAL
jgi:predicted nuclease with RNAse H fold